MSYDTKHRMNTAYLLIMLKQSERIESLVTYSARQAGLINRSQKQVRFDGTNDYFVIQLEISCQKVIEGVYKLRADLSTRAYGLSAFQWY